MPRDTDRPDPYVSAPLGERLPRADECKPAPAPAPIKAQQPATMTEADVPMIIRDCYAKQSKMEEPMSRISVKAAGSLTYKDGSLTMSGWHWYAEGPGPWTQREMAIFALEYLIEQVKQDKHEACDVLIWRDGTKTKPSNLNEQQRADWLRMSAEAAPELHPRRHLDWPILDV
jgi:hypothetical protein